MGTSSIAAMTGTRMLAMFFQNLNAFVVNLTPHAGIGDIAERGPIDIRNEIPTGTRKDYDLVGPILRRIANYIVRTARNRALPSATRSYALAASASA
jgi:hypothetical protein